MGVEDYSPNRDENKDIPPGDITISADPLLRDRQIINAIRQMMADLADMIAGNDDGFYQTGSWTPVLTYATPGDLNVVYSVREGSYRKIGKWVKAFAYVVTSTHTYTTASGELRLTGLPFSASTGGAQRIGNCEFQGITMPAGTTQLTPNMVNTRDSIRFVASGSGASRNAIDAAETASGTNIVLVVAVEFEVAT